jgi:hypothetical protein
MAVIIFLLALSVPTYMRSRAKTLKTVATAATLTNELEAVYQGFTPP